MSPHDPRIRHLFALLLTIAFVTVGTSSPVYALGKALDLASTATPSCGGQPATIIGTQGDDTIDGTAGNDVMVGRAGDDLIHGLGGDDLICGGPGSDGLSGGAGNDTLWCSLGFDDGGLSGGGGNDTLYGGSLCSNALHPGPGDDLVIGRGAELNAVFYEDATGPVHADLTTGIATGQGTDTLVNVDALFGGPYDDTLIGDDGNNDLVGLVGNDTLIGNGGVDFFFGDVGDDTYEGGRGFDFAEYYDQAAAEGREIGPMHVNLRTGIATGDGTDTLSSIEAVSGSDKADVMIGNDKPNFFFWLFDGYDTVRAGRGNDFVQSSAGANDLSGGAGRDTVGYLDGKDLEHQHAAVTVDLGAGTSSSGDALSGFEDVYGSPKDDTLIGGSGPNRMFGWFGDDVLKGRAGDDRLDGMDGSDRADGGGGTDRCWAEVRRSCESGDGGSHSQAAAFLSRYLGPSRAS